VTGETTRDITGETTTTQDEFIRQISRTYIDVPTAEEFLNNFENAYAGFLQGMRETGLSQTDITAALDPGSGIMDTFMDEYMGELAQRAARGEDIFEVVGLEGEPVLIGERPGEVTTTEITRMTTTEAERVLRESGQEVTQESVSQLITADEEEQRRRQEAMTTTTTTDQTVRETEEETTRFAGERRFEETEQLFERPRVVPVFKFSPTEFLQERFPDPGMLSTVVRARAGQRRAVATRGTTGVVAGVQRA
jgi:hypothetical protein